MKNTDSKHKSGPLDTTCSVRYNNFGSHRIIIDPLLLNNLHYLEEVCRKYPIIKLYSFGSVVDGRFYRDKSDVDFLIEFQDASQDEKASTLIRLWMDLQNIFYRKVDLISSETPVGPAVQRYLEEWKTLIYDVEAGIVV